jgi:hypothetical protein
MDPVLANIRGKTVKHASIPSKIDFLPRHIVSDLVLDVDIMSVNTCAFLLSVAENIGNTIVTELGRTRGSRSTPSLRKAYSVFQYWCLCLAEIPTNHHGKRQRRAIDETSLGPI